MEVADATNIFRYAPEAGAAGCFVSRVRHRSVAATDEDENDPATHLKIAFFFRERNQKPNVSAGAAGSGVGAAGVVNVSNYQYCQLHKFNAAALV